MFYKHLLFILFPAAKFFYKDLYKSNASNDDDIEKYFEAMTEENSQCEGLVTIEECTLAMNKMKHNKSPGLDGITVEFYQTFWPLLCNF